MTRDKSPRILRTVGELRAVTGAARREGRTVGFVPTMGALHQGHLSLVDAARERTDLVVVSVFVNPTQFGPGEDLERYPRDLERDARLAGEHGADVIFAPAVEEMYPEGSATVVTVERLTDGLCGPHRPGHFQGVATVVTKLFNQVGPCVAFFGRKDYQQLKVIQRLVTDLAFDIEVVGMPTVREPDGLALSSRNVYLSAEERPRARALVLGLARAWELAREKPAPTAAELRRAVLDVVTPALDSIDYVEVRDPDNLEAFADDEPIEGRSLVAVAARLGSTRLIDNVVIREDRHPLTGEAYR